MTVIAIDLEKNAVKKIYFDPAYFEGTGEFDKPFDIKESIIENLTNAIYDASLQLHNMQVPLTPLEEAVNLLGSPGDGQGGTWVLADISAVLAAIEEDDARVIPARGALKVSVTTSMMIGIVGTRTRVNLGADFPFEIMLFNNDEDMDSYLDYSIPYLDMPETYYGDFYFDDTVSNIEAYFWNQTDNLYTSYYVFTDGFSNKKVYASSIPTQGGQISTQEVVVDWQNMVNGNFAQLVMNTFYSGKSVQVIPVHKRTGIGLRSIAYSHYGPVIHDTAKVIAGKNASWAGNEENGLFRYDFVVRNRMDQPLPLNAIELEIIPLGNPSKDAPIVVPI